MPAPTMTRASRAQTVCRVRKRTDAEVTAGEAVEAPVETLVEPAEGSPGLPLGPEEQRAERRAQREGGQSRDEDRGRDGEGEVPVELAGDAPQEGHGDEHRREDERDRDDRALHLVHGAERGVPRSHPTLVDVGLHGLGDHDGVVHDETDGEDESEERGHVDAEPEHHEGGERADHRDGHGQERDESGPPILEEDEHHEQHQENRLEQGADDLLHGCPHEGRGVEVDDVVETRRELLLGFLQELRDAPGHGEGVGARRLVHEQGGGGAAVEPGAGLVGLRPQLHPGHVFDAQDRPVRQRPHHHAGELVGLDEPALREHLVLEVDARLVRGRADLARRVLAVLLTHDLPDVGGGETELGELVGIEPEPHPVPTLPAVVAWPTPGRLAMKSLRLIAT